jgi:Raf kinase inhibitor-like YbhB/YbcL family protein
MHKIARWALLSALIFPTAAALGFMPATGMFVNKSIADTMHMGSAMYVSSPAFKNRGPIPVRYARPAAGGANVSIPLNWNAPPMGTKSFALSLVDHHPIAHLWTHWIVINIPAAVLSLPEGASGKKMPPGSTELLNSFGAPGYGGPQPPAGSGPHPYVVTVYALNVSRLDLAPNTTLGGFKGALRGKILGKAKLTGYFEK